MKKMTLLLGLCFVVVCSFGQTLELEKAAINAQIQSGDLTQTQVVQLGKEWNKMVKSYAEYPNLPVNDAGVVIFEKIYAFDGKTKQELINLLEEWIAINYGNINDVLHYKNESTGKVIAKGRINIAIVRDVKTLFGNNIQQVHDFQSFHTAIFTAKDNKIKLELINIKYEAEYGGYTLGSSFVPVTTVRKSLHNLYPVVLNDSSQWKGTLNLLVATNKEIAAMFGSIESYIKNSDADNDF